MAFVHLHTHSCYSLLDGKSTPAEIVNTAKKLGQNAIALTDHGVMHGVVSFYNEAKKAGIKPVIGCEVYVAPGSRFDKTGEAFKGEGGKNYYHLILLAKDNNGYKNLMKIVSQSYTDGYYYKPRADKELLAQYKDGLIATSACLGGPINQMLMGERYEGFIRPENYERAKKEAIWYRDTFGADNYYIELQNHGIPEQLTNNPYLERIAQEIGVKCIVANDAHYAERKDAKAHEVMLCIQTKALLTDEDRFKFPSEDFYIKSETEMLSLFPGKQEYLDNTQEIADKCNVTFEFDGYKLPEFPVPEEYKGRHGDYLKERCRENFENLYPGGKGWTKEHQERFNHEFKIISEMGFIDYFLIVQDYINWAKEQGIYTGPSRGCTISETLIYTSKGLKEIKDIRIGDMVYTHDGTLKEVENTFRYDTPGEEVIKPVVYFGGQHGDYYTKDHKVYAIRDTAPENTIEKPEWIPISELKVGDLIAFPRNNDKFIDDVDLNAGEDKILIDDNYIYKRIYRFDKKVVDEVYDICVKDNHSYVTNSFAAHNSAGGSLICYMLGITSHIDPLEYGLIFERFLNPSRISMPNQYWASTVNVRKNGVLI